MEKYNGWTNYDTWLVNLWLMNDEGNYDRLKSAGDFEDYGLDELQLFYYGDDVDWDNVNVDEIILSLEETF